jgi:hypothetical protein
MINAVHNIRDYKHVYPALIDAIERGNECFIDKPVGSEKLLKRIYKMIK